MIKFIAKNRNILVVVGLGLFASGCVTMNESFLGTSQSEQQMQREIAGLKAESRETSRELATLRTEIRTMNSNVARLSRVVEQQREMLAQQQNRRSGENTQLNALKNSIAQNNAKITASIRELSAKILQEEQLRKQSINSVIKAVSQTVAGARAVAPEQQQYTVVAGDTLSAIAKAFGVSIRGIKQVNNLHGDRISIGQKLKIPTK